jgi:hypothetical protein
MAPESMKKHQTNVCVKMADGILRSLAETNSVTNEWVYRGDRRIQRMIQMLSLFLKEEYFFLYTHFPRFRQVFSAKIDEMWEMANAQEQQELYSRVWLDELISTCTALRNKIAINESAIVDDFNFGSIPTLFFL